MKHKTIIIGVDEVGRGSWAGPITACAATFKEKPPNVLFKMLHSSKLLKESVREKIASELRKYTLFSIASVSSAEIDRIGLQNANKLIFLRSVKNLIDKVKRKQGDKIGIEIILDGRKICDFPYKNTFIIRGDETKKIISAASILAKVRRDQYMKGLHKRFPYYSFSENKGYGTKKHHEALKKYGISPFHRRSYKPIQNLING